MLETFCPPFMQVLLDRPEDTLVPRRTLFYVWAHWHRARQGWVDPQFMEDRRGRLGSELLQCGSMLAVWHEQARAGLPMLPPCGWCGLPTGNFCEVCDTDVKMSSRTAGVAVLHLEVSAQDTPGVVGKPASEDAAWLLQALMGTVIMVLLPQGVQLPPTSVNPRNARMWWKPQPGRPRHQNGASAMTCRTRETSPSASRTLTRQGQWVPGCYTTGFRLGGSKWQIWPGHPCSLLLWNTWSGPHPGSPCHAGQSLTGRSCPLPRPSRTPQPGARWSSWSTSWCAASPLCPTLFQNETSRRLWHVSSGEQQAVSTSEPATIHRAICTWDELVCFLKGTNRKFHELQAPGVALSMHTRPLVGLLRHSNGWPGTSCSGYQWIKFCHLERQSRRPLWGLAPGRPRCWSQQ